MENRKSATEKFIGLFTEINRGEGVTALLMTLNIFLILTAYLIAKVVREPLILTGGGAEIKSYSSALQVIILMGALRFYSWLAGKYPRKQLINYVTLFFVSNLILFYGLILIGIPSGVAFFLWVGIFSLTIIAQFWSFANDVYTPDEGNRLFVIIGFGASAGGVIGPKIAGLLIDFVDVYEMLLISAGILLTSLFITNYLFRREDDRLSIRKSTQTTDHSEPEFSKEGAFRVVFQNKYLLLIALLILFTNWVNTTGEYIIGRAVSDEAARLAASSPAGDFSENTFIARFYADYYFIVGMVGLMMQLFIVSRILKYLGVRFAIMALPVIAFGGYFLIALFPTMLNLLRWAKTAENATDYSLNNTVRHILFLPTTREEKYKAKVAIDSFFVRAGDVLSAAIVFTGVTWLSFSITGFAIFNMSLVGIWLLLAFLIGRKNRELVNTVDVEKPAVTV